MEPKILDDPREIINLNNKYRYNKNIYYEDLWTLEECEDKLKHHKHPRFEYPVFHNNFTTRKRKDDIGNFTQSKYNEEMNEKFPVHIGIINSVNNNENIQGKLLLVGSVTITPFNDNIKDTFHKVDLIAVETESKDIIKQTQKEITYAFKDINTDSIKRDVKSGLVTITIYLKDNQIPIVYQIYTKIYPTISMALHSFNIGSSCIAYDGKTTYMTTLGAYAQYYHINLVIPEYRCVDYEYNLAKYHSYGYCLGLIDLNVKPYLYSNDEEEIDLYWMKLILVSHNGDNCLYGYCPPSYIKEDRTIVDKIQNIGKDMFKDYSNCKHERLKMEEKFLNLLTLIIHKRDGRKLQPRLLDYINDSSKYIFNVDEVYFRDVLSHTDVVFIIDYIIKYIVKKMKEDMVTESKDKSINVLMNFYLNMNDNHTDLFREEFRKCINENPNSEINVFPTLKKFRNYAIEYYEMVFKDYKVKIYDQDEKKKEYDKVLFTKPYNSSYCATLWYTEDNYKACAARWYTGDNYKAKSIQLNINW